MRIGVFDSGVGGLTVLNKLVNKYPNNEYIYFGDIKNNPYGNKTIEDLEKLASNIIDFLIREKVDIIVIACGTVSSNLGSLLKNKYNIKIIDIITPVIEYINNSNYNKIGVISTEATSKSKVFDNIKKDKKLVGCKQFVPIIESNNYDELDNYIDLYLNELRDRDLVVLGCTHYPIIRDKISNYLGSNIEILDMSECLPKIDNDGVRNIKLYFSELKENTINIINNILSFSDYEIIKNNILM